MLEWEFYLAAIEGVKLFRQVDVPVDCIGDPLVNEWPTFVVLLVDEIVE